MEVDEVLLVKEYYDRLVKILDEYASDVGAIYGHETGLEDALQKIIHTIAEFTRR